MKQRFTKRITLNISYSKSRVIPLFRPLLREVQQSERF